MVSTDYAKFEKLIEEEEEREKQEKEAERLRIRLKHEAEQKEKQRIWDEKLIKEGKDPVAERKKYGGCAFSHMQHFANHAAKDHNHGHDHHGHNHDHENHSHSHNHKHDHDHHTPSKSSCGYMPVEEIERLAKEHEKNKVNVEDKNKKKIEAVYAAKEDGNRVFKEKNYKLAYKIYERGALIINGMYQLSDKQEEEMENIECLLDLNMALASLKLEDYSEAINCCKMALQIDEKSAKAYYRWSEALICMSDYNEARKISQKAKELEPKNIAIDKQLKRIDDLQREQLEKAKKEEQKIAQRIRNNLKKKKNLKT